MKRHFSGIFTFFGSHTSEESQSSWNSHYLRYWRRWTFLLYHRGIYSGTIHWHFCVISKNFPWTFNKIWHPALWYFRLSASFNAISNPISGSKTRAYYSMWKSDKINRFWNCIFFYRFWKKLSNLRNNGFCCAGGSEWSSLEIQKPLLKQKSITKEVPKNRNLEFYTANNARGDGRRGLGLGLHDGAAQGQAQPQDIKNGK